MAADLQVPAQRPADAVSSGWVDRAPAPFRPYLRLMRLDRPIGVWLLFWPCAFGLALGAAVEGRAFPDWWLAVLFAAGSVVMRGAGCTFNDIVDRDYDALVARTRARPIASGAISLPTAWAFAVVQCAIGLVILVQFAPLAIWLGVASLPFIAVYPFMKRITWWPQAWLGITFNWGALMGYAAETETLALPAILLYGACILWTIGYDTIYAHQDKEDDALIGIRSTARLFGYQSPVWVLLFYAGAFALFLAAGWTAGLGYVFTLTLLAAGAQLLWQVRSLDVDRPLMCLRVFRSNQHTGAFVFAAYFIGALAGL